MAIEAPAQENSGSIAQWVPGFQGRLEWVVAGFLTVLWTSALLTYGAGYFGWFEPNGLAREASFLEYVLYFSGLVLPVILTWIGAYFVHQTHELRRDTKAMKAALAKMNGALEMQGPSSRAELLSAITEATSEATRVENNRVGSQLRTLNNSQIEVTNAVKKLLTQSGADKEAIHKLVVTAQDVAEKAKRKVSNANSDAISTAMHSARIAEIENDLLQDPLPLAEEEPAPVKRQHELEWDDITLALNFPQDESDKQGFAAIKRVLPHRHTAQLLQSAEDVLSMLSQEGIYMDDLSTAPANPDIWRNFAAGARGDDVAEMGTVTDQAALALAKGRMRNDEAFREASLHFLRYFDRLLTEFADNATDRDLTTLAGTRSGLAFLLLAKANGTFS